MLQTYPYDNDNNYTKSDSDKIEIDAGKVQLKLQQGDVDFIEDFADDTGHIYDSDLVEFKDSEIEQKSQIDALSGANFNIDINLEDWSEGIVTGIPVGGASISGNKLDLTGETIKYVDYNADLNADSQQTGCIRFKLTPNYSGGPVSVKEFLCISKSSGANQNSIKLFQSSTLMFIQVQDFTAGTIISSANAWIPVSGTKYEIEFNWDITAGASRLFINGIQNGPTHTGTGIRDGDIGLLRIGSDPGASLKSDFYIEDLLIFDSVQHTANYTPGYSVPAYKYSETSVILPEMEHTGDGSIKLFNSLTSVYAGSPRILLEIGRSGNKLYWNGSSWVTSDETYNQATDPTTFNTNCSTLDVDGEKYGQFTIVFPDSNTLSSYDELTANLNVDIGYPTDNPYIYPNSGFKTDGLEGWVETLDSLEGTDAVKRLIKLNSDYYYLDGSNEWVTADTIDYTKAMTVSEILAQKESLLTEGYGKTFIPITFLHSGDGLTTPYIDTDIITYNYSGEDYVLSENIIYGNNLTIDGEPYVEYATVKPIYNIFGETTIIRNKEIPVTINNNGYWEVHLYIENEEPDSLLWKFGNKLIKTNFLTGNRKFSELTIISGGT